MSRDWTRRWGGRGATLRTAIFSFSSRRVSEPSALSSTSNSPFDVCSLYRRIACCAQKANKGRRGEAGGMT